MPPSWPLLLFLLSSLSGVLTAIYLWTNARFSRARPHAPRASPAGAEGVTVVVPVLFQDPERFRACLSSIDRSGASLIVVTDGPDAGSASIAAEHGARLVALPVRSGKKAAIAAGLQEVRTPFVLLLDSDTVLPPGAVGSLRSHFSEGVGGVSANLEVPQEVGLVSSCSEFVERSREVVLRATSSRGSVLLLDGACTMYRTAAIRSFVLSPAFLDLQVLGRSSPIGDDWLLTGHLVEEGWRAVKAYDVPARSPAPSSFRGLVRRNVRWARSAWIRLGKELTGERSGRREERFYRIELFGTYLLPLLTLAMLLTRLPLALRRGPTGLLPPLLDYLLSNGTHAFSSGHLLLLLVGGLPLVAEATGGAAFLYASYRCARQRSLRLLLMAPLASSLLFVTTIYGLLTFWRTPHWEPVAPAPQSSRETGGRRGELSLSR